MTIKEIEARTGLPRANIRFYETQGLIHPARGENGYRDYGGEELETLLKIKLLRQVGFSLEEISALKEEKLTMDGALLKRMEALDAERGRTEHSRRLCEKLREDNVSWSGLEPERYLNWTSAPADIPVPVETEDIGRRIPWRRYFARTLDLELYSTAWMLFCTLVLRLNMSQVSAWRNISIIAASLLLTFSVEPLMLHRFGTTPGKWLLGLKVTRSDGSFFSVKEARERTGGVLLKGVGLEIPLVSLVTNVLSYLRCCRGEEQPWELWGETWSDGGDGRDTFWERPGAVLRTAGYIGAEVLLAALTVAAILFAATPPHRGDLTVEQFADNYNALARFSGSSAAELDAEGRWQKKMGVLFFDAPELQFETENGAITAVSFSLSSEGEKTLFLPDTQTIRTFCALLGSREFGLAGDRLETVQELAGR